MKLKELLIVVTAAFSGLLKAQIPQKYIIPHSVTIMRDNILTYSQNNLTYTFTINPGDTLEFTPGSRAQLQLRNFNGLPNLPIIITHKVGSITTIDHVVDDATYGMALSGCKHMYLLGNRNNTTRNDTVNYYGLKIKMEIANTLLGGTEGTSDIKIQGMEFYGPVTPIVGTEPGPAISIKSNQECKQGVAVRYTRETFLLTNVTIQDNLFKNSGLEAIYIGAANGNPLLIKCDVKQITEIIPVFDKITGQLISIDQITRNVTGTIDTLYPHYVDNVNIINNLIFNSGGDGIQVSLSSNASIKNNVVSHYGALNFKDHVYGISFGGSSGEILNNYIGIGVGLGMRLAPVGDLTVTNNFVSSTGYLRPEITDVGKYRGGIAAYATDVKRDYDRGKNIKGKEKILTIAHNLLYNQRNYGILAETGVSRPDTANPSIEYVIANNVIIAPAGLTDGADDDKKNTPYIRITKLSPSDYNDSYGSNGNFKGVNYVGTDLSTIRLKNTSSSKPYLWDITPQPNSPLVNKGVLLTPESTIFPDYYRKQRLIQLPQTGIYDVISNGNGYLKPDYGPVENHINVLTLPNDQTESRSNFIKPN